MTVVVAYSADKFGEAALEHGAAEAARGQDRLIVVNVTKGDAYVDTRYAGEVATADLQGRLDGLEVEAELRQVMSPDVAEEILDVANAENARLVVVGIRRRTPLGKLVLGSVAQHVILDAECPVLAVKPAR